MIIFIKLIRINGIGNNKNNENSPLYTQRVTNHIESINIVVFLADRKNFFKKTDSKGLM